MIIFFIIVAWIVCVAAFGLATVASEKIYEDSNPLPMIGVLLLGTIATIIGMQSEANPTMGCSLIFQGISLLVSFWLFITGVANSFYWCIFNILYFCALSFAGLFFDHDLLMMLVGFHRTNSDVISDAYWLFPK